MKDYKLSELKRICENADSCKLCYIKELCDLVSFCAFRELDIDENEEQDNSHS